MVKIAAVSPSLANLSSSALDGSLVNKASMLWTGVDNYFLAPLIVPKVFWLVIWVLVDPPLSFKISAPGKVGTTTLGRVTLLPLESPVPDGVPGRLTPLVDPGLYWDIATPKRAATSSWNFICEKIIYKLLAAIFYLMGLSLDFK